MNRRRLPLTTAALAPLLVPFALGTPAVAAPQDPPPRPKYKLMRQNEDWSFLKDPELRTGDLDSLKYIPLSESGDLWASIGGEWMSRFEVWRNFNGGAPAGVSHDDEFLLTRLRLHGSLNWSGGTRLFGELKSAQATDRDLPGGRRGLDFDTFDIQQLFVEHRFELGDESALTVRPGRQMLQFGAQRLVSPLPWGNTLRAWDGLTVDYTQDQLKVTGIATAFVPVDKTDLNEADTDQLFYGLYVEQRPAPGTGTDYYWLGNQRPNQRVNGTAGESERQTVGVRHFAKPAEHVDTEIEVSYQFGDVGQGDVSAWSVASVAGYRPGGGPLRAWVGLDWASGDSSPGGNVQTFDPLYPLGHAYFGYLDSIGRSNAIDTSMGARWKPIPRLTLALIAHSYWLDSKTDAIYNAGSGVVRPGPFQSSWIGWEVNGTATWAATSYLLTELGLGRFFLGDAMKESSAAGADDIDFAYLSLRFAF